jgi:hypothetical protein
MRLVCIAGGGCGARQLAVLETGPDLRHDVLEPQDPLQCFGSYPTYATNRRWSCLSLRRRPRASGEA